HNWETLMERMLDKYVVQSAAGGESWVPFATGMECERNYFFPTYVADTVKISFIPKDAGTAVMRYKMYRNGVALTGPGTSFGFPTAFNEDKELFVRYPIIHVPSQPGT